MPFSNRSHGYHKVIQCQLPEAKHLKHHDMTACSTLIDTQTSPVELLGSLVQRRAVRLLTHHRAHVVTPAHMLKVGGHLPEHVHLHCILREAELVDLEEIVGLGSSFLHAVIDEYSVRLIPAISAELRLMWVLDLCVRPKPAELLVDLDLFVVVRA